VKSVESVVSSMPQAQHRFSRVGCACAHCAWPRGSIPTSPTTAAPGRHMSPRRTPHLLSQVSVIVQIIREFNRGGPAPRVNSPGMNLARKPRRASVVANRPLRAPSLPGRLLRVLVSDA
jgi:hypothetical protein